MAFPGEPDEKHLIPWPGSFRVNQPGVTGDRGKGGTDERDRGRARASLNGERPEPINRVPAHGNRGVGQRGVSRRQDHCTASSTECTAWQTWPKPAARYARTKAHPEWMGRRWKPGGRTSWRNCASFTASCTRINTAASTCAGSTSRKPDQRNAARRRHQPTPGRD